MSVPTVSAPVAQKRTVRHIMKLAIFLGLMFGVGFLPPFGDITELGMKILGIFFALILDGCF